MFTSESEHVDLLLEIDLLPTFTRTDPKSFRSILVPIYSAQQSTLPELRNIVTSSHATKAKMQLFEIARPISYQDTLGRRYDQRKVVLRLHRQSDLQRFSRGLTTQPWQTEACGRCVAYGSYLLKPEDSRTQNLRPEA